MATSDLSAANALQHRELLVGTSRLVSGDTSSGWCDALLVGHHGFISYQDTWRWYHFSHPRYHEDDRPRVQYSSTKQSRCPCAITSSLKRRICWNCEPGLDTGHIIFSVCVLLKRLLDKFGGVFLSLCFPDFDSRSNEHFSSISNCLITERETKNRMP